MIKIKDFLKEIYFLQTNPRSNICPLEEVECSEIKNKKTFEEFCSGNYENCPLYRLNSILTEDS